MEACVARVTIHNAGEFNGFLKPKVSLLAEPLRFAAGELVMPPGVPAGHEYRRVGRPHDRLRAICESQQRLAARSAGRMR